MNSSSDGRPEDAVATTLLVDDDQNFCSALAGALRRRGERVVIAHNSTDALREARAWSPHRATIDLRLGEESGLELVRALRALLPELKIVVLTGYGSIATAVEAIKAGAVHYLTKPATIAEIVRAFEQGTPSAAPHVPSAGNVEATVASLDTVEWEHLQRVLHECGGNVSEAARRLGLHRRTLQRKLGRNRPTSGSS